MHITSLEKPRLSITADPGGRLYVSLSESQIVIRGCWHYEMETL